MNLVLTPEIASQHTNQVQCLEATLTDSEGNPVTEPTLVEFKVTAETDENGVARFCFTNELPLVDDVMAVVGDASATAEVSWYLNGICGKVKYISSGIFSTPTQLCASGTPTTPVYNSKTRYFTWSCIGEGEGHSDAQCRAKKT